MKLLLHTCCGPCLLYPLKIAQDLGYQTTAYFYNPNIHPYTEYKKRYSCLIALASDLSIEVITEGEYGLIPFTRKVVNNEDKRCTLCYDMRLTQTALLAKKTGYSHFSTTLLYSRYQKHDLIKNKCQQLSALHTISFLYHDFRDGWQLGIDESIDRSLYRQPYCGCIYSEQERYDNRLKKKLSKRQRLKEEGKLC